MKTVTSEERIKFNRQCIRMGSGVFGLASFVWELTSVLIFVYVCMYVCQGLCWA